MHICTYVYVCVKGHDLIILHGISHTQTPHGTFTYIPTNNNAGFVVKIYVWIGAGEHCYLYRDSIP